MHSQCTVFNDWVQVSFALNNSACTVQQPLEITTSTTAKTVITYKDTLGRLLYLQMYLQHLILKYHSF